jgi:uncharacterized sulfatase
MVKTLTYWACGLLVSFNSLAVAAPNVVIIFTDDLGIGDIAPYGNTLIKTPNLDRMAANGVKLTSFYSSANVCTPSRGGLLMGQYPIRNGLTADVARPTNKIAIPENAITIADGLKTKNYATACIGKWHLGHRENEWPTEHGFDYFYGLPWSNDMLPLSLYRQSKDIENPVDQTTLTKRYTEESIEFIKKNKDTPFFLYLAHSMPHIPLYVSKNFERVSKAGLYGDVIEELDWSVGQILDTLESLDLDENTLVVFTSDNGPWWEGSAGQFRNRKGSSWEGGMRVPMLAQWTGKIPAGTESEAITMNIDLLPTVFNLAKVPIPSDRVIDGKDIWQVLTGNQKSPHEFLYLFERNIIAGVRSQNWKLVYQSWYRNWNAKIGAENYYYPPGLLFDMKYHPEELYSMTRENPEIAKQHAAWLKIGQNTLEPLAKKKK